MHKIKEELLQFIWKHKLLKPLPLISTTGKPIKIIKTGDQNSDAGPDFFNAMIIAQGITLSGNIELHVKSSDWKRHKHDQDKNYDNVILHVVYEHDELPEQNLNNGVEVVELKEYIDEGTLESYSSLTQGKKQLPCSEQLRGVSGISFSAWVERMAVERLENKLTFIESIFNSSGQNYAQTFYTLLLRSFGFKVNAQPFEMLARQLPLNLLLKHSDNLIQLQALFLGTAGFLDEEDKKRSVKILQNEFEFLKAKYRIVPLQKRLFKFSRLRPSNFPDLRLLQMADFIHQNQKAILQPLELTDTNELKRLFYQEPVKKATNFITTKNKSDTSGLRIGNFSVENVLINAYAPYFFFYSKKSGDSRYSDYALKFLEECAFENNLKTRHYLQKKELLTSSMHSQGLIHLYDHYCKEKKCLSCGIGLSLLKAKV